MRSHLLGTRYLRKRLPLTAIVIVLAALVITVLAQVPFSTDNIFAAAPWPLHGEEKPTDFVIFLPWRATGNIEVMYAYGEDYNAGTHEGTDYYSLDFKLPLGTDVYPITSGVVMGAGRATAGWSGYGNFVMIDHGNGYQSLYAHLSEVFVTSGQSVGDRKSVV